MTKKWILKSVDPICQKKLSQELNLQPFLTQLLMNRGVFSPQEAELFLSPSLDHLKDPFLLKDMDKVLERLKRAYEKSETVLIYGDYDVDGITATAVLYRLLKKIGIKVLSYIPHRMDEGYSLNYEIIPLIKEWGVSLLITVDCGITSIGEVEALVKEGFDVIITDHHEPEGGRIPTAALAVINPKRSDCPYPFKELAGVGIASKVAQAILKEFPLEDLDLITLGTIADVVPLRGENRIIARFGLPAIEKTSKIGLQALFDSCKIRDRQMSPYLVGFSLGPRLNAAGRMGSASIALQLLLSEDYSNATSLAMSLEALNRDRQALQGGLFEEAISFIEETDVQHKRVMIVHKDGWHKGILGIVASKISEKYGRPAIVITFEDGIGAGSARSVEGFYLNEAFEYCADLLESFGGHKRAAGLRIKKENIVLFKERIEQYAGFVFSEGVSVPTIEVDAQVPLSYLNMELVHILKQLEPFGEGNPQPVFATRRLMVKSRPQMMGKDTIKFWVTDGKVSCSVIGFGMGSEFSDLRMGHVVDMVYTIGIDDWNKEPQVQVMLKDMRVFK